MIVKRGGSTQTTITDISYPTSPPASTQHHGHKIPEIAGSSGGFLGLVIGLGVLIIASCVGVYILLKKKKDRGEPLWRKRKAGGGGDSRSKSMFGGRAQGKGWVRTGDGDNDQYADDHSHGIGLSVPSSRSRSPNPEVYTNREQVTSASAVKLSAPGPYPDAFSARDSIDSLVEAPNTPRGQYHGVEEHDHDDSKYSPTSPGFERGTRFKEGI